LIGLREQVFATFSNFSWSQRNARRHSTLPFFAFHTRALDHTHSSVSRPSHLDYAGWAELSHPLLCACAAALRLGPLANFFFRFSDYFSFLRL
jgi:hypothetical protein